MLHKAYVGLIAAALAAALIAGCGLSRNTGMARGRDLFKTCVPCHGENGHGNLDLRAPAIAGLPEWYIVAELQKFKGGIRGSHPDDNEGHRMSPMARTLHNEGDLETVAKYVASMPVTWMAPAFKGDDAAAGMATYTGICATCHGPDGKGNKDMGSPPIVYQSDWYLVAQLGKFQSGMRGSNPQDITGGQMRAMSLTMPDTTAMHNVVAYLKTLPH